MEYIGDVHAGESQICTLTEQGEILERLRPHPPEPGWGKC